MNFEKLLKFFIAKICLAKVFCNSIKVDFIERYEPEKYNFKQKMFPSNNFLSYDFSFFSLFIKKVVNISVYIKYIIE